MRSSVGTPRSQRRAQEPVVTTSVSDAGYFPAPSYGMHETIPGDLAADKTTAGAGPLPAPGLPEPVRAHHRSVTVQATSRRENTQVEAMNADAKLRYTLSG